MKRLLTGTTIALTLLLACSSGGSTPDTVTSADTSPADQANPPADVTSTPDTALPPEDNTAPPADTAGDSNTPTDPFDGMDLTPDPDCTATWLAGVKGFVVDEEEAPSPGTVVQLCIRSAVDGGLSCLNPKKTLDDGSFTLVIPLYSRCMSEGVVRLVLPKTNNVVQYCSLDLDGAPAVLELSTPYVTFGAVEATTLPERGVEEEERTVVFEDGLEIDIIPATFFGNTAGYEGLSSRRLLGDEPGLCTTKNTPVEFSMIYAFSPEGDVWKDSYAIRVPVGDIPEGHVADLYVLGGLNCTLLDETHLEETEWGQFATGVAQTDGYFSLPKEQGIPCIGWLGVHVYAP